MDCCYSGAVKGFFSKAGTDDAIIAVSSGRGVQIITSSTGIQISNEKEGDANSIFTKFLVEGLQTGHADTDSDGLITLEEAYEYTYKSVRGTGLQTPMSFNLGTQGMLTLAYNRYYKPFDPSSLPPDEYQKYFAIKSMIDQLNTRDPPTFFIALNEYTIEGERYMASGLTVDPDHTPNIRQTPTGFECDAFFKPDMINEKGRKGKEVVNSIIKVRMQVESMWLWSISCRLAGGRGAQFDLGTWSYPGHDYAAFFPNDTERIAELNKQLAEDDKGRKKNV